MRRAMRTGCRLCSDVAVELADVRERVDAQVPGASDDPRERDRAQRRDRTRRVPSAGRRYHQQGRTPRVRRRTQRWRQPLAVPEEFDGWRTDVYQVAITPDGDVIVALSFTAPDSRHAPAVFRL